MECSFVLEICEKIMNEQTSNQVAPIPRWMALEGLGRVLTIEFLSQSNLPRANQLLNKTNQMSLSTRWMSDWFCWPEAIIAYGFSDWKTNLEISISRVFWILNSIRQKQGLWISLLVVEWWAERSKRQCLLERLKSLSHLAQLRCLLNMWDWKEQTLPWFFEAIGIPILRGWPKFSLVHQAALSRSETNLLQIRPMTHRDLSEVMVSSSQHEGTRLKLKIEKVNIGTYYVW